MQGVVSEFRIIVTLGIQDVIRKEDEGRFWGTSNFLLLKLVQFVKTQ